MSANQPPPPPPGGHGAPPPAGGPGAQPPGPGGQWDLGATVSYGWNKFQQNMAQIIIAALAMVVGMIVIAVVGFLLVGLLSSDADYTCEYDDLGFAYDCEWDGGTPFILSMILFLLVYFVMFLYAQIIGAGIIRGALGITEGRPFQASEVFKFDRIGPVVVTSLIVGAATFVGLILCYLPGLVIMFATSYSLYFVIDKGMAPMDAIKASVNLVKENLSSTLIWYIVGGLIATAGAIVCGLGMLVTIPIMLIGTAYTYKTLTGQPVAP